MVERSARVIYVWAVTVCCVQVRFASLSAERKDVVPDISSGIAAAAAAAQPELSSDVQPGRMSPHEAGLWLPPEAQLEAAPAAQRAHGGACLRWP